MDVELGEENEEHNSMSPDIVRELPWELAIIVQNQLEPMNHDAHKLDHLKSGHVLFPPDVLLIFWPESSHEVVKVHENMHERVQQAKERGVSTRDKTSTRPNGERHDSMMNHMKEGDLIEFLPGHEAELSAWATINEKNMNDCHD